jgi:hypothetical protein
VVGLLLAACAPPSPTPSPTSSPTSPPNATASAPPATASATAAPTASPTPAPSLSLELPSERDPRVVAVTVTPEVAADGGGRIVVRVTSLVDTRIDELVLRWPTELAETLFLAPFTPSEERIADGGPPLVQPWTKWVVGPGEQGEPDGTTSLGWGPLLPGATLEIPILVMRVAPGPTAFDLQVLSRNDLLALGDGSPAEVRVDVP